MNGIKKLVSVDDYEAAWRCADAGQGWITYRDDFDYLCAPGVIAYDDDIWDGGVGASETELHLSDFLFAIQPHSQAPDLTDMYAFASELGVPVVQGEPVGPGEMAKDMLEHEPYVLDHPVAGPAWRRLKKDRAILYAILAYSLHRKGWKKDWVERACRVIHELHDAGVKVADLRSLRLVDPLLIERARDYKAAGSRVPRRLKGALAAFEMLTTSDAVPSAASRSRLEKELHAYRAFLAEYQRRRKQRFNEIADDDLQTAAGPHKDLLLDRRGRPNRDQLATRAVKAVFVSLTDEFITTYGMTMYKAARLAGRLTFFLFLDTQERTGINPFKDGYTKKALNAYRYAKESRPAV